MIYYLLGNGKQTKKIRSRLKKSEVELIVSLYEKTKGNSRACARLLGEELYFTQELNFSDRTIVKYWRKAGLEIRGRGGANNLGKTWTWGVR